MRCRRAVLPLSAAWPGLRRNGKACCVTNQTSKPRRPAVAGTAKANRAAPAALRQVGDQVGDGAAAAGVEGDLLADVPAGPGGAQVTHQVGDAVQLVGLE